VIGLDRLYPAHHRLPVGLVLRGPRHITWLLMSPFACRKRSRTAKWYTA
jgi:hypothetical protein